MGENRLHYLEESQIENNIKFCILIWKMIATAVCSIGNFPFPTSVMPKIMSTNVLKEDKTIKKGIRVNYMWT